MERETIAGNSNQDTLTGLYHRQAFFVAVKKMLTEDPHTSYVLIRWDVKRFKVINDLFGIEMGDRILQKIAAGIQRDINGCGIAGRLESDHFVVCVPKKNVDMEVTVQRYREDFRTLDLGYEVILDAGLYVIDDPSLAVEIMCDRAGLALQTIKENYQKRYAYYDHALREQMLLEQMITGEMRGALEQGQFQVYMQPQFNYVTGEIIGAEALVRWEHPTKGMVEPSQFISIFERNGFISRLDEYVWEKTCQYIQNWLHRSQQVVPVAVAVNISRLDICNPKLCDTLRVLTEKYEIPAEMLRLEITESAYVEHPKQLIEVVKQLQRYGFIVEMDDFGSGYSSLNTLKDVPVDVLKLDLKFLSDEDGSGRGGNILGSVVRMAQWLGLPVIAEGVETKNQADYLKSIGCYHMQGYYFAKPMKVEELEKLLMNTAIGKVQSFKDDWDLVDENEFWDPNAQMTLIFNHYVGGAGILEYQNHQVEALRINDKYLDVMGCTREVHDQYHLQILKLIVPADRNAYLQMLDEAITTAKETHCEARFLTKEGQQAPSWILSKARVIAKNSQRHMFYVTVENITAEKERERSLRLKAEYDGSTGVYNKTTTESMIDQRLTASIPGSSSALFILDVDDFKCINDRMGHLFGDSFIKLVATELRKLFRGSDITGRIGGDEFVAFMDGFTNPSVVHKKANQLLYAFRNIQVPEVGNIRCSIGVAFSENGKDTYHTLLEKADRALYRAKRKGKDNFVIDEEKGESERERTKSGETAKKIESGNVTCPSVESTLVRSLCRQVFEMLHGGKTTEAMVESLLEVVGAHFQVSRAYVAKQDQDSTRWEYLFRWQEVCTKEEQEEEIGRPLHQENFNSDGIFYCRDIAELPTEQYERLHRDGVQSILQCAIVENGEFRGYVGFDECKEKRFWTQEQIDALIFIAEVLRTFLLKDEN